MDMTREHPRSAAKPLSEEEEEKSSRRRNHQTHAQLNSAASTGLWDSATKPEKGEPVGHLRRTPGGPSAVMQRDSRTREKAAEGVECRDEAVLAIASPSPSLLFLGPRHQQARLPSWVSSAYSQGFCLKPSRHSLHDTIQDYSKLSFSRPPISALPWSSQRRVSGSLVANAATRPCARH